MFKNRFLLYIISIMPAKSEKQRRMMAIAEHHPEKLYKQNKGVLKMSKKQLHEFAVKKKAR